MVVFVRGQVEADVNADVHVYMQRLTYLHMFMCRRRVPVRAPGVCKRLGKEPWVDTASLGWVTWASAAMLTR